MHLVTGFLSTAWHPSLRRRPALPDRCSRRHATLRLQRRDHRRALPGGRRGVRGLSARAALRAEGELDPRHRPAAAQPSAAASTPTPAARSTSRCAPGSSRRRSSSPASARPRRSSRRRSTSGSRRSTPNRTGSSNGSTRWRASAADAPRVALRVNPDIDARSHPHISTGLKTNKFGIALDRRARDRPPLRAARGARDRRPAQPRRLADHRPGAADRAPPARSSRWRASCATTGSRSSTSISAAASGFVRRLAGADRPRLCGRAAAGRARLRAGDRPRAGPQHRRARRRAPVARRRREAAARAASSS